MTSTAPSAGSVSAPYRRGPRRPRPTLSPRARSLTRVALGFGLLAAALLPTLSPSAASAHGLSSVAYLSIVQAETGPVTVVADLEYDLFVVSAADTAGDDDLFQDGIDVTDSADQVAALTTHADTVLGYIADHVRLDGAASCAPTIAAPITAHDRDGAPYATVTLDYACADGEALNLTATPFPDAEGFVTGTTTIVDFSVAAGSGTAALNADEPSADLGGHGAQSAGEFLLLGAEHLLGGLDHILFLLALIVGSRRLRDVVIAATTFTLAHSITFLLAAVGLVNVPAAIVEPLIALSIAVVALWYLIGVWRRRGTSARSAPAAPVGTGPLGLNRADWARVGVVFAFGLLHGLGFASALGIEQAWSWGLLWSLLVFNVGIELVQLALIAVCFPLLALVRRRWPRAGAIAAIALTAAVTIIGLFWFVERIRGLG